MAIGSDRLREREGERIRLLVVDDHWSIPAAFRELARDLPDIEVVGELNSAEGVVEVVEDLQPDVVIVDIRLGGPVSGTEVTRRLKDRYPDLKVFVYSAYDALPYVTQMREIGIEGYFLKSEPMERVLEALRGVAKGNVVYCRRVSDRMNKLPGNDHLTAAELQVLKLLAAGLTNREMAERLSISRSAVEGHVTRILDKLGATNRTDVVVRAVRQGLIVIDEPVRVESNGPKD